MSKYDINSYKDSEPIFVKFAITTCVVNESSGELLYADSMQKVKEILNKYHIGYHACDTMAGDFNLNRAWIEFDNSVKAYVSYDGVYVDGWSQEDFDAFVKLINWGKIEVRVFWYDQHGKYIADNH